LNAHLLDKKIGFIGFGKMARALWKGMVINPNILQENAQAYVPSLSSQKEITLEYGIKTTSLESVVKKSDILFFCLKPQQLYNLLEIFPKLSETPPIIISILAGTKLSAFQEKFGQDIKCIRLMPNTPVQINQGTCAISYTPTIGAYEKSLIQNLFKTCGLVIEVDEKDMDIVTAISGSGPAFIYQIIDDISKAGIASGLDPKLSLKLTIQTLIGASHMLRETEKKPEALIHEVCSPNGTTEAGLNSYKTNKIGKSLSEMIIASKNRSISLSK